MSDIEREQHEALNVNAGAYVIVRSDQAGVHCGFLESVTPQCVVLRESRQIWEWEGAFTLREGAEDGFDWERSKFTRALVSGPHQVIGPCEILRCSEKATKGLRNAKSWEVQ